MSDDKFIVPLKSPPSTPTAFGNPFYIGYDDENEKGILLRSNDERKPDLFLESYSDHEKNLVITSYNHGLLVEHDYRRTFYNNKGKIIDAVHGDELIEVHDLYLVLRQREGTKIHVFDGNYYIDVQEIIQEDDESTTYMI